MKKVLITGANRGLGLEVAKQFAEKGDKVIGTSRSPEKASELKATGADVLVTACPKCHIHLNCALNNLDADLQIRDLTSLLAEAITVKPV